MQVTPYVRYGKLAHRVDMNQKDVKYFALLIHLFSI